MPLRTDQPQGRSDRTLTVYVNASVNHVKQKEMMTMTHFQLEPIPCEPDGHEGFPLSFKVYDTFRGKAYIGTMSYMTTLQMYRTTSVYASAEEVENASVSITSSEKCDGDIPFQDTSFVEEARKLYKMYWNKLNRRERLTRTFDVWWPVLIGALAFPVAAAAIVDIVVKVC